MSTDRFSKRINKLFRESKWDTARTLLEQERSKHPESHWVLTQLGVTFYEQRQYQTALQLFTESQELVEDCPLTIWNIAGALSSLGDYVQASRCYVWLLTSDRTPEDDPCWESREWTESLKADCIFRLGDCFQGLGKTRQAEQCYRRYLDLRSSGTGGTYSIEAVAASLRNLNGNGRSRKGDAEFRKAIKATLALIDTPAPPNGSPPKVKRSTIRGGKRVTRRRVNGASST